MDLQQLTALTLCLSKVALAAGTTSTVSTTGTTVYAIQGVAYSKGAITNGATPTVDFNTGLAFPGITANQGTVVIVGLDAGGNVRAVQGGISALDVSGNFILAPTLPVQPEGFCPIGKIVVKAGAAAVGTWTFGSNNLSGVTGLTYSFGDLVTWPARPVTA